MIDNSQATATIRQHDSIHNPFPLDDGSIQMVITSPPYYNAREVYASWPTYQAYLDDMAKVWRECWRVLCDGGRIAVNVPMGYGRQKYTPYVFMIADVTRAIQDAGFVLRGHIIWNKIIKTQVGTAWGSWMSASNPTIRDVNEMVVIAHKGDAGRNSGRDTIDRDTFLASTVSVWDILPETSSWHPAPFPTEIPRRLIELYTYLGDTILDPFSGSGTTIKVAQKLGRNAIGYDLSAEYVRRSTEELAMMNGDWELHREMRAKRVSVVGDLPLFAR